MSDDLPPLALSVRQPWAWALFNGKTVENRTKFAINHMHAKMKPGANSWLTIHASQGMTQKEYVWARDTINSILGDDACPRPDALVRSAVIGRVLYIDTVKQAISPWFFGPRALVFSCAQALAEPIGCDGALGFFDWRRGVRYPTDEGAAPLPWMRKWAPDGGKPGEKPAFIQSAARTMFDGDEP